jgi:hypothetical protein
VFVPESRLISGRSLVVWFVQMRCPKCALWQEGALKSAVPMRAPASARSFQVRAQECAPKCAVRAPSSARCPGKCALHQVRGARSTKCALSQVRAPLSARPRARPSSARSRVRSVLPSALFHQVRCSTKCALFHQVRCSTKCAVPPSARCAVRGVSSKCVLKPLSVGLCTVDRASLFGGSLHG